MTQNIIHAARVPKPSHSNSIAVVGLGYVGLPLAILAAQKGYRVIGIDTDVKRVHAIRTKKSPFADERISHALQNVSIQAYSDFDAIADVAVIIICVPTPVNKKHTPDLRFVRDACARVGKRLRPAQLVVIESTVNPGVTDHIIIPLLETNSSLRAGEDFFLAHCPERINPGDALWHLKNIPRVVGGIDTHSTYLTSLFYRSLVDAPIKEMGSVQEAEAVKIVENSFRDVNIAFVNELAQSFSVLGIDIMHVLEGAATKPFGFMPHYPGCGVGGHCIPVDPYYLIDYAKRNGFHHTFLSLARRINNGMPAFTVDLVRTLLQKKSIPLKGSHIAVLGLSYKADVDDRRESPSLEIIRILRARGARVITHDPFVPGASLADALSGAQAVIVATDHAVFRKLTPKDFLAHDIVAVVDGRNCLQKEKFVDSGILYTGIGR